MKRTVILGLALAMVGQAAATRIGVFDLARGDEVAFAVAPITSQLRNAILSGIPNASFVEMNTLTAAGLNSVDILFMSSVKGGHDAIEPLSAGEQTAMAQFVAGGGTAVLVVDNDSFDFQGQSVAANQSLVGPFGLVVTGTSIGLTDVNTVHFSNPISNGPFGIVNGTTYSYAGFFQTVPSAFTVVCDVVAFPGPAVVFAPKGALSAGSGGVIAYSDFTIVVNDFSPPGQTLLLNSLAYGVPPKELSGVVDLQDTLSPATKVDLELRPVGGGTSVLFEGVNLAPNGAYALGTRLTGDYEVWAKASHWLGKLSTAGTVHLASTNVTGVNFSLPNGDVNRDNEVGIGDYAILSSAYGSFPGDGNWVADADLDGDEEVAISDYAILSSNFNEFGD